MPDTTVRPASVSRPLASRTLATEVRRVRHPVRVQVIEHKTEGHASSGGVQWAQPPPSGSIRPGIHRDGDQAAPRDHPRSLWREPDVGHAVRSRGEIDLPDRRQGDDAPKDRDLDRARVVRPDGGGRRQRGQLGGLMAGRPARGTRRFPVKQGLERPAAPCSHRRMPQDCFGRAGRVACDLGQQFVAAPGVAGLRVLGFPAHVHDRAHEHEVLAVLRGDQRPDRGRSAAAGGQRGQGLGGDLRPGERPGRGVCQLA